MHIHINKNVAFFWTHIALSALYAVLFILCVGIVIKNIRQKQMYLTWQKFFHPMLLAGTAVRALFFCLQSFIYNDDMTIDNRLNVLLNSLPSFFFFSNYLIILFLWAEIYHNAHDSQHVGIEKLRPLFLTITIVMYACAGVLYMLDFILYPRKTLDVPQATNPVESAVFLFTLFLYLGTSLGFLFYGGRIYFKFSSVPIYTRTRKKVLRKIQTITFLVVLCFIVRLIIIGINVVFFPDLSGNWWFDIAYFGCLEFVPLTLMLIILHADSQRRTTYAEVSPLLNYAENK